MSSRSGTRPVGTDGSDFQHRQRVAAQYQTSASYKFYLKALFGLHFTVLLAIWAKVFGEIGATHFGMNSALWKRLDLPSAYPWEYVKPMTYAYYGQFFTGILPCSLGLGSQFPELIAYIADPVNNETPTIKGSFPMVVIWFIFFLIAFQLHIFAMYFKYYLLAAWNPLPVEEQKDEKEKKTE
uniref:Uncharacterized protein n=1 Tax=Panagrolaimus sp. PS1159 TaxID=55785 RepID=A0AC35GI48_9BILA